MPEPVEDWERCTCQALGSAYGGEEPAEVVTDGCPIHDPDLLPPWTGPEPADGNPF